MFCELHAEPDETRKHDQTAESTAKELACKLTIQISRSTLSSSLTQGLHLGHWSLETQQRMNGPGLSWTHQVMICQQHHRRAFPRTPVATQIAGPQPESLLEVCSITRQQIPSDREHLARSPCNKAIDLPRVLLHLSAVEHALQPRRLGWQFEKPLPLVFGKQSLLRQRPCRILCFSLRLPLLYLCLLSRECPRVVTKVVGLSVVCLDGVKEEIAGL